MIKITYGMNVINCDDIITHQLASIYKHADEIIIIEGAYEKFKYSAPNATSTDLTVNKIINFPDPEKKIKLRTHNVFFEDRAQMCSEIITHTTGDVLFQIDVDEFYHDETHTFVRDKFNRDHELDEISFMFIDFFFDQSLYILGTEQKGLNNVRRVFRLKDANKFHNQRPPVLEGPNGIILPRKVLDGKELRNLGHCMYHATIISMRQIKEKTDYYAKMWGINNTKHDTFSYNGIDLLNVHGIPRYFTPVCLCEVDIPKSMKPVFNSVDAKLKTDLFNIIDSPEYILALQQAIKIIGTDKKNYFLFALFNFCKLYDFPKLRLKQFITVQIFCILRVLRTNILRILFSNRK